MGETKQAKDYLLAAAVGALLLALNLSSSNLSAAATNRRLPEVPRSHDFTYKDVNPASATHGQRLKLSDLYSERGLVLNFIASWCAPCWMEVPTFEKFDAAGEAPVVCIAADEYGPKEDLLRLAKNAGLALPILLVPKDEITRMEQHYDHAMLPATYLIDRDGGIRHVFQGLVSHETLEEAARRHLR